jgi:3-methylcrotonyl-CoA carboxylase alpha subunit
MEGGRVKVTLGDETREVRIESGAAVIGDRRVEFSATGAGERIETLRVGGEPLAVRIVRDRDRAFVWCSGEAFEFRRAGARAPRQGESAAGLSAPMPGRIRRVVASEGSRVARGDVILILEAMKMEHAIRATADGVVARVFHSEGDLVDAGAALAEIR